MKYEMIFGDEGLFDGAPEDAEYAGWFCQETRWYMILNGKILFSDGGSWCTSDNPYLSADIAAMRRIIKDKVDDENELENLYWEFDSQRSKKTTDERLLFKGKLRYYASIASVDKSTKEPNRWTLEDKKAGRLPEVGAKCSKYHSVDERTVLSVTDKYVGIERDNSDMNPYFVTHDEFLQYYIPIETPAEKAARLKSEWCANAAKQLKNLEYTSTLTSIYDALLSGELQVPKGE